WLKLTAGEAVSGVSLGAWCSWVTDYGEGIGEATRGGLMDLSQLQAVLLDMDGTLVDSDAAVERSWRIWAAAYPVDPGRGPRIAHGVPALGNVRRLRPDLSEDEAAAAARYQLELEYVDVADITATPGAHELLGELDRLGLPWAVVTSADPPLARTRLTAA